MKTIKFLQYNMEQPKSYRSGEGEVVVFTTRSPEKTTENEDACAIFLVNEKETVLTLADGMGGLPQGQAASSMVIDTLESALQNKSEDLTFRNTILNGLEDANKNIINMGTGAGSTAAVVEIAEHVIRPYHIGDSKILVVGQRGKVKLETLSHSPTEYAVEAGYLKPEEAIEHQDRRFITNMMGAEDMRIELGSPITMSKYDTLLIASDGLIDNLHQKEIIEIIRKGKLSNAMNKLLELCFQRMSSHDAEQPSAPDDVCIILYRNT